MKVELRPTLAWSVLGRKTDQDMFFPPVLLRSGMLHTISANHGGGAFRISKGNGFDILEEGNRRRVPLFMAGDYWEVYWNMAFTDVAQPITTRLPREGRKPYVAPACRRLTPEAARELLLQKADLRDPEVKQMLQCIDELQKGSRPV